MGLLKSFFAVTFTRPVILLSIALVTVGALASCSSDDPVVEEPPTPPAPAETTGSINFDIDIPGNDGDGSLSSPAKVKPGETFDLTIKQKSEYHDPDGSTFTCEPKAEIKIHALADTVKAVDMAALTAIEGKGFELKSDTEGTAPVRQSNLQTFHIGPQEVTVDLAHEIYTYVNSQKTKIEMPYLKLNPASLGGSTANEEPESKSRSSVAMTLSAISVRPLVESRGRVEVDSTLYEVTAQFSLKAESMNTKSGGEQTIAVAVSYVGLVETATELADPTASLTYEWITEGATQSLQSPFVMTDGRTMTVTMAQKSAYTDEYGISSECEPRAVTKLAIDRDTVWTTDAEMLKIFGLKDGGTAADCGATQLFGNDGCTLTAEWNYEKGQAITNGNEIAMPYYSLGDITVKGVTVTELNEENDTENSIENINPENIDLTKITKFYKIKVTLTQRATTNNTVSSSEFIDIDYVVSYVGAVESKLVNVEYIPGGEWVDSHDNLVIGFYPNVTRRRRYSNGTVLEDVFRDFGHPAAVTSGPVIEQPLKKFAPDGTALLNFSSSTHKRINDSLYISTKSIELLQSATLKNIRISRDSWSHNPSYDSYTDSRLYPEYINIPTEKLNTSYPSDSRPTGWYFAWADYQVWAAVDFYFIPEYMRYTSTWIGMTIYDQFLVIDGIRIEFKNLLNFKKEYSTSSVPFSTSDKEGYIFTLEGDYSCYGKKFHSISIDSVYVSKQNSLSIELN